MGILVESFSYETKYAETPEARSGHAAFRGYIKLNYLSSDDDIFSSTLKG
jgi:hypothetical protein